MQTSKLLLVICAVTLLAAASSLRADETEAQKRAREALRQKMEELEGQPQPTPPAAPVAPKAPVAAPATPPPAEPVVVPGSSDSDAQARALEALRQRMNEGQSLQPGVPGVFSSAPVAVWSPGAVDSDAQARARAALRQKMLELEGQQAGLPPVIVFRPLEMAPSPFSGPKAGRLAELLRRYQADQITPEEYHKQRAAILAEP